MLAGQVEDYQGSLCSSCSRCAGVCDHHVECAVISVLVRYHREARGFCFQPGGDLKGVYVLTCWRSSQDLCVGHKGVCLVTVLARMQVCWWFVYYSGSISVSFFC